MEEFNFNSNSNFGTKIIKKNDNNNDDIDYDSILNNLNNMDSDNSDNSENNKNINNLVNKIEKSIDNTNLNPSEFDKLKEILNNNKIDAIENKINNIENKINDKSKNCNGNNNFIMSILKHQDLLIYILLFIILNINIITNNIKNILIYLKIDYCCIEVLIRTLIFSIFLIVIKINFIKKIDIK